MVLTLNNVTEDESDLDVNDLNERNMLDAIFDRDIIMSCRTEVREGKEKKQLANSY